LIFSGASLCGAEVVVVGAILETLVTTQYAAAVIAADRRSVDYL
jgi:hypothetical protein